MTNSLATGNRRRRPQSSTCVLEKHRVRHVPDLECECAEQQRGNEETPATKDLPHSNVPTSSSPGTHADGDEETIITSAKFIPLQTTLRWLMIG